MAQNDPKISNGTRARQGPGALPRTLVLSAFFAGVVLATVAAVLAASVGVLEVFWPSYVPVGLLILVLAWSVTRYLRLDSCTRSLKRSLLRRDVQIEGLRASEELHKAAARSVPDGMLLAFDHDLRFILAEGGALVLLRLQTDDLLGATAQDVFPDAAEALAPAMRDAANGTASTMELPFWNRIMRVRVLPLEASGSGGAGLVVANDLTHEQEARNREKQLMQAGRLAAIGTLVTGVAHEINNPNTVISLNAPMVESIWKEALPHLEDAHSKGRLKHINGTPWDVVRGEVGPMLEKITASSRRIRTIVSDLKDFGGQGGESRFEPVDLHDVVLAATDLMESKIRKCSEHFSVNSPGEPLVVMGDFQRLEQVVINAIINACEALESSDQAIEVHFSKKTDHAEIQVRDQGRGMDDEALQKALDPFFTTKQGEGGTGLGLAISQSIMEKHGGMIRFESWGGAGTICRIILPLAAESDLGEEMDETRDDAMDGRR